MTKFAFSVCLLIVITGTTFAADDLAQLERQLKEYLLTNKYSNLFDTINPEHDSDKFLKAGRFMKSMQSDGSWKSIDYTSKRRGGWPVNGHMSRVTTMAKAYCSRNSKYSQSSEMLGAIRKALQFWLENDFVSPNWWHNQIGVPREVGRTLILVGDRVPEEVVERSIEMVMARARIRMTGQNRIWLAGNVFMRGLLTDDAELVTKAANAIAAEVRVTTAEGVQPDWSFHQHGPQLQFGNYGLSYANDCAMWANILRGTRFAFDDAKIEILRNYLLNGQQWVVWNRSMDISACGRQLFPGQPRKKARLLAEIFPVMAAADKEHMAEYMAFTRRYLDDGTTENAFTGHKHFWRSDFTVHRRPDFYCSVKMCSPRVIGAESGNSENLLGYHLADGATYIYRNGDEYRDIFPVWDWRKLPGTTCLQSDEPLPQLSWSGYHNGSDFVGGVSDGNNGVTVMDYDRDGLRAKKVWFFHGDEILCLGAGISTDKDQYVVTTIDQCLLNGEAVVYGRDGSPMVGKHILGRPAWMWHNRIGYALLENSGVYVSADKQTGKWSSVYSAGSDKQVSKEVFRAQIEHGKAPQNASYAYKILPGVKPSTLLKGKIGELQVIANTENIQAATCDDWAGIIFHKAGSVKIPESPHTALDKPGLVMLERKGDTVNISVAEPTANKDIDSFKLTLSGKFEGENCTYDGENDVTSCLIELPTGKGQRGGSTFVSVKKLN
ncbi:Chondroitinase-AC precursor [Anaerohalosphaera lusitana]|uniref:Chondroitinase-AC n=1 Tax=Anaerohalosphaera lusitana TaxID=1936003 RepID=A0A1U9NI63_9BACT|nr:polysaccharide lyase 8 family protein [Anaerohalosphaera lusitana]AQT67414.1 Chondroitinase-AC precursor [Anaerohalosphaera lusitana]